jgi:hypothetical protein
VLPFCVEFQVLTPAQHLTTQVCKLVFLCRDRGPVCTQAIGRIGWSLSHPLQPATNASDGDVVEQLLDLFREAVESVFAGMA